MSNRVAIAKAVTVRSVNGPEVTVIVGQGPNGSSAVRCAYVTNGASLAGFTLQSGGTRTAGNTAQDMSAGGVWCKKGAVVSNCVIRGNSAFKYGGGAYYGTLINCLVVSNRANIGGGTYYSTNRNCTLSANTVVKTGTVSPIAGGVYYGFSLNCIVYGNTGAATSNAYPTTGSNYFRYTCATPLPGGSGNMAVNPLFVDSKAGDFRLKSGSPCIDRGMNDAWMTGAKDLSGNPRVADGDSNGAAVVDMGAYENLGTVP